MESVNWEKLRLPVDPHLIDPTKPNIRGVTCELTNKIKPVYRAYVF